MASKLLLECEKCYHIFNHAISNDRLYNDDAEYSGFIRRYVKYISPIADTIAFCLMPNHYHICLKIRGVQEIISSRGVTGNSEKIIYRTFSDFLNGFVQYYNKKNERIGGLFVGNFKRKELFSDSDLIRLICYIHKNPVEAGLTETMEQWPYSSYRYIISPELTSNIPIWMEEHLRIFDDLENLIYVHHHPNNLL